MFRKSASQAAVFIYTCPQDHPFVFDRYALRVTDRFGHGQSTAMPRPPHYWQCRWHPDFSAEAEPASFNNKVIAGGKPMAGSVPALSQASSEKAVSIAAVKIVLLSPPWLFAH